MALTIDQAGRVVIPKQVRDQFNLISGSKLEIETSGNEIRLRVADFEPSLIEKNGILVHHGTSQSDFEIVGFLKSARKARSESAIPVEDS